MTGTSINGRAYARDLTEETRAHAEQLREELGIEPGLTTVLVGGDYSARAYERQIHKRADALGVTYKNVKLPQDAEQADVLAAIGALNADPRVTGILLLRPVPEQIDERDLYRVIDPLKDIESMHPVNAGLFNLGTPRHVPSTPASIVYLLDRYLADTGRDPDEWLKGRRVVVVGRSANVGQPVARIFLNRGATGIACDVNTSIRGELEIMTKQAEVLVVAVGVAHLIKAEHVSPGTIVIDVGINAVEDPHTGRTKMVGDVDFDGVIEIAEAVSPVPGGVGPITEVCLVRNTVAASELTARARDADKRSEWTLLTAEISKPRDGKDR